ncbi:ferritin-like domain-containing protein [Nannocystis bainbridge]|uniref:Ferritin-like domain-containing protein n=1 Tax=Nannocystis bainbridge TaxID=2995303 RepID=A0ABT5ECT5_9BACT|nr:ferritin-like domain-containing protein [Nannocystis bainbridge]MDC0723689.1 ferritin-like domain-containing protein [Nannocystis bainbridge]
MTNFDFLKLREAEVLAVLLRAAGMAPLVLAGACTERPVAATEGSASGMTSTGDGTTASTGDGTTTSTAPGPGTSTEPLPGTITETEPTTAPEPETSESATDPTDPTVATSQSSDTSETPDCPIDHFDTVECTELPGETTGETTGDTTTGDTTGTTGADSTTGDTTGDTMGDSGACAGVEVPVFEDCGLWPASISPPFEQRGQCCVNVSWQSSCCGRPFLVEETARTARPLARDDWGSAVAPALAGLSAGERAALAAGWLEDGLAEHASVAAFARFALQLLALGAPASLVEAAQQAMADEVAHARLCFGLAGAYGGEPRGPSPLPLAGALTGADDLVTVTVATLREGCIGETFAALQAEAALARAEDPAVRAALARIAADELRHAELAWRFVAWALERGGPAVYAACAAALAAAEVGVGRSLGHVEKDMSERMLAHGRLGAAGRMAVARRAMTAVIGPAGRALLARHAPASAA